MNLNLAPAASPWSMVQAEAGQAGMPQSKAEAG